MSDRELLELAGKAAGYTVHGWIVDRFIVNFGEGERGEWNPFTDDGDALRLAVALELDIVFLNGDTIVLNASQGGGDANERTRRAIVRAAAEIGRATPVTR